MLTQMDQLDIFESNRRLLFGLAYRMLGSRQDAEDAMQDAWLRWANVSGADNPRAYLCRIVTNICLDKIKNAQAKREVYVGEWLPEPIPTNLVLDSQDRIELAESINMAFMVTLQSLSANERAAFLLKHVFDFDYAEMSVVLRADEATCRQRVSRAKAAIEQRKPRYTPDAAQVQRAASAFMAACATGDISSAIHVLTSDARAISDGGGKIRGASIHPIVGAENVARLFMGLFSRVPPNTSFAVESINASPAIVLRQAGVVFDVILLEVDQGQIRTIYSVLNPDKLHV